MMNVKVLFFAGLRESLGVASDTVRLLPGTSTVGALRDLKVPPNCLYRSPAAPGVAAAACVDLGFAPRAAGALYQIASLPGLLAHGLEMSRQGLQAMPFVPDENYEFLDPRADETARGANA